MTVPRALILCLLSALPSAGATIGTVVARAQPLADLVVDEARRRLYVVNTASSQVEIYATPATTASRPQATIKTALTPLALALSRSGRYLYVACYDGSSLDIIDLDSDTFSSRSVTLSAKPQAVAVGFDEKVLIATIGTGTGASVLVTYDPNADASAALRSVAISPPAPVAPTPPVNGNQYLAGHARLAASADGRLIVGVTEQAATRAVFSYDAAANVVLASRTIAGLSPILAISPDSSKFISGPLLFETSTLLVLAQQSPINSPFVFPTGANFNTQTAQGGAAFTPDGSLLTAYNIVPMQNPAVPARTSQLLINSPDNMLIQLGLMLPENLSGKIAITSDGGTIYAISQSGFMLIPIGTLRSAATALALPDQNAALLAFDPCGVTAGQNSAVIPVRSVNGGRITPTAQVLTASPAAATVRVAARPYGGDVTATFSAAAQRALGTSAPDQLLIQAPEAINIIPNVRVFQNSRNPVQRGAILPLDMGATNTGLADMLADTARRRLYIANPALNRVEVFDMERKEFLTSITVGQLPRSLAFGQDNNTLYVANSGGEHISIVDLEKGAVTGRVRFPPVPFNSALAVITPSLIASSQRGAQVLMSDGTLWHIVGDSVAPRTLNPNIFGTARSVPAPQSMTSTPDGSFVLLLAGNGTAYLYSAADDDFVASRTVIPAPIQGYYGALAAGPDGQYFLAGGEVLNQALTSIRPGAPAASRPVYAVASAGARSFVRFSSPTRANAAAPVSDAGLVEVVDAATFRTTASATALEGPLAAAVGTTRVNVSGRMMALDPSGAAAYVLTASGLSLIPLDSPANPQAAPQVPANGIVNTANYHPDIAPGGLISIFGRNLATPASTGLPLPLLLGGACVTLNNAALPLLAASEGQINAQVPPTLAAGRYPLVVHSIVNQAATAPQTVTVARYAPAVFLDSDGPMIFHSDGTRVDRVRPAKRDEPLTIYATGLGATTGGRVIAGQPAPSEPLAVTAPVKLFFGDPSIKEAEIIVDWSGLLPGYAGVYQINARVPGAHVKGDDLPITIRIGGVDSPVTGPLAATIFVD
ncbi:MAG TPA: hypothetical protein VGF59_33415 [Bryobacteraceae bacterium]